MFKHEFEMAEPVERWLRSAGGSCVGHEVTVGYGIADLVAGIGEDSRLRNRRRQAAPIDKPIQLALLDFCTSFRTIEELRDWAPRGWSSLQREALRPLLEQGLLMVTGTRYRSRIRPKDPFDEIVAVELKLRDARRGVAQAAAYRTFADRSYLALPSKRVQTSAIEASRKSGVGLLSVEPDGVEVVVMPSTSPISTPLRRRIASERVLEASRDPMRVAGSPSPSLAA